MEEKEINTDDSNSEEDIHDLIPEEDIHDDSNSLIPDTEDVDKNELTDRQLLQHVLTKRRPYLIEISLAVLAFFVTVASAWFLYMQNQILEEEKRLMIDQNKLLQSQNKLIESERRSSSLIMLSNIYDQISHELKSKPKIRKLSPQLIARIISITQQFTPYVYMNDKGKFSNKLSPERASLFLTLMRSKLNIDTYTEIFNDADFSYSDFNGLSLRNFNMEKVIEGIVVQNQYGIKLLSKASPINLANSSFQGAKISNCTFYGNFIKSDFSGASFTDCKFIWSNLNLSKFENCAFDEVVYQNCILTDVSISKSRRVQKEWDRNVILIKSSLLGGISIDSIDFLSMQDCGVTMKAKQNNRNVNPIDVEVNPNNGAYAHPEGYDRVWVLGHHFFYNYSDLSKVFTTDEKGIAMSVPNYTSVYDLGQRFEIKGDTKLDSILKYQNLYSNYYVEVGYRMDIDAQNHRINDNQNRNVIRVSNTNLRLINNVELASASLDNVYFSFGSIVNSYSDRYDWWKFNFSGLCLDSIKLQHEEHLFRVSNIFLSPEVVLDSAYVSVDNSIFRKLKVNSFPLEDLIEYHREDMEFMGLARENLNYDPVVRYNHLYQHLKNNNRVSPYQKDFFKYIFKMKYKLDTTKNQLLLRKYNLEERDSSCVRFLPTSYTKGFIQYSEERLLDFPRYR